MAQYLRLYSCLFQTTVDAIKPYLQREKRAPLASKTKDNRTETKRPKPKDKDVRCECLMEGELNDDDERAGEEDIQQAPSEVAQTRRFYGVTTVTHAPKGRQNTPGSAKKVKARVINSPIVKQLRPEKPLSPEVEDRHVDHEADEAVRGHQGDKLPETVPNVNYHAPEDHVTMEVARLREVVNYLTEEMNAVKSTLETKEVESKKMKALFDLLTSDVLALRQELRDSGQSRETLPQHNALWDKTRSFRDVKNSLSHKQGSERSEGVSEVSERANE